MSQWSQAVKIVIKKNTFLKAILTGKTYSFWTIHSEISTEYLSRLNLTVHITSFQYKPQILFMLCQRRNSDLVTHSRDFIKFLCFCAWKGQFYTPKIVTIIFSIQNTLSLWYKKWIVYILGIWTSDVRKNHCFWMSFAFLPFYLCLFLWDFSQ